MGSIKRVGFPNSQRNYSEFQAILEMEKLRSEERRWNNIQKFEERKWKFRVRLTVFSIVLFTLNIIILFTITINQPNLKGIYAHIMFAALLPFLRMLIKSSSN